MIWVRMSLAASCERFIVDFFWHLKKKYRYVSQGANLLNRLLLRRIYGMLLTVVFFPPCLYYTQVVFSSFVTTW